MQLDFVTSPNRIQQQALRIDHWACQALLDEVSLDLKPGLVCPNSQGSHTDMDYDLFLNSIDALKGYFHDQYLNGYSKRSLAQIRARGIEAEQKMLQATHGINTHKGAIFNLGFAAAAIGRCVTDQRSVSADTISMTLQHTWGFDLLHHFQRQAHHHGQQMRQKYGMHGAIEEVASGFKTVREHALPAFKHIYQQCDDANKAATQALLQLMACVQDTNIVWRGGISALLIIQQMAQQFIEAGGVEQLDWKTQILSIGQYFTEHNLSPGGSADLLGVTLFLYRVEHEFSTDL